SDSGKRRALISVPDQLRSRQSLRLGCCSAGLSACPAVAATDAVADFVAGVGSATVVAGGPERPAGQDGLAGSPAGPVACLEWSGLVGRGAAALRIAPAATLALACSVAPRVAPHPAGLFVRVGLVARAD